MLSNESLALGRPAASEIGEAVAAGLRDDPKRLPYWLLYDELGSQLFEAITALPDYYLTRTERLILDAHAAAILDRAGPPLSIVELGAGSAEKTRLLLRELCARQRSAGFYPVDISPGLPREAARLRQAFPALEVVPVAARYPEELSWLRAIPGRRLVLFLGSSIGNLDGEAAVALLSALRAELEAGDALLLGTDLIKEPRLLLPAYDDPAGVTARFVLNLLGRINRELDGRFDLAAFRHVARWNARLARVELYLESRRAQVVPIHALDMQVELAEGELIHAENSHKYTLGGVARLLRRAGFHPEGGWADAHCWFAVTLARA